MYEVRDKTTCWSVTKIGNRATHPSPPELASPPVELWRIKFENFRQLPPMTREYVSVLAMAEPNEYIQGMGRKVTSGFYWLDDGVAIDEEYKHGKYV